MSGPLYLGFVVEEWSEAVLDDVKRALPPAIQGGFSTSAPECFELVVHAHEGSAWLVLDDVCTGPDPSQVGTAAGAPLAAAIAKAARSPTWLYEYNATSSFYASATRFSEKGEASATVAVDEDTEVPRALRADPDFDFTRFAQDHVSASLRRRVRWEPELLRTGSDDDTGPAIVSEVEGDAHPLAPYFTAPKEPAPAAARPPAPLLKDTERLEQDASRAARTLDNLLAVLEKEPPDLERYLARSRDDRLDAAFDPALETLKAVAELLASAPLDAIALPISPEHVKRLEHQKTVKGAPKTREQLVERLKAAREGLARENVGAIEHAIRSGRASGKERLLLAGQLKLIRLVLHLAHLALLEGEDILRESAAKR